MSLPTAEEVRRHQSLFPLAEREAGPEMGLGSRHGAFWLCRDSTRGAPRLTPLLQLRERNAVVEVSVGWYRWVPLAALPWSESAEWEPADQEGVTIVPDGDPELLRSDPGANYLSLDPDDREGSAGNPEDEPEGEDPCET